MRKIKFVHCRCVVFFTLAIMGFMVLMSGCGGSNLGSRPGGPAIIGAGVGRAVGGAPPPPAPAPMLPKAHLWEWMYERGTEPSGYGMYTYVLINQNQSNEEVWARYSALVEAIQASTTEVADFDAKADKSLYNVFLFPSTKGKDGQPTLNDRFSRAILTAIRASTKGDKLRKSIANPGPFLISVGQPLTGSGTLSDVDLLYADLSATNKAAMREVVSAYKLRIEKSELRGTESFDSIRLSLLSLILNADEHVQVVKVVYAGLKDW